MLRLCIRDCRVNCDKGYGDLSWRAGSFNKITGENVMSDNYMYDQQPPQEEKKGMSIASMVLGIVGLIAWCIPIIGGPVGIVGLILGIVGMKKGGKGMAIAGIIMSVITIILAVINAIAGAALAVSNLM